jgi:TonB family protein
MIRSVVTKLLIAVAVGGAAFATAQLGRTCETAETARRVVELARCMASAQSVSLFAAPAPSLSGPDPVAPHRLASHSPMPILLRQEEVDPTRQTSHGEALDTGPAAATVPLTSVPRPRDDAEVRRLLAEHYPTALARAGTGGMVVLSLMISSEGLARASEVVSGSGVDALDEAALEVARRVRFTPAAQQGRIVEARILFPVVFDPS